MALPLHNGIVYQIRLKKHWKESWLCLESNGTLTWKRRDAYEVKGEVYLDEILHRITVNGWNPKKCKENDGITPFIIQIPIGIGGSKSMTKFALKRADDLDSWLASFASLVGKWKLWKICKRNQALKLSQQKSVEERNVENALKYEELIEFYTTTWREFVARYKDGENSEDISNGSTQKGTPTTDGVQKGGNAGWQTHRRTGSSGQSHPAQYQAPAQSKASLLQPRNSVVELETIEEDIHF